MSNAFVTIKMCYVYNQWYAISCATLQLRNSTLLNKVANGVLHDVGHRMYHGFPYFQNVTVSWHINNSDIIYNHKKSATFPVPVFMKITNAEQCHV